MYINKWLVTDDPANVVLSGTGIGISVCLDKEPDRLDRARRVAQQHLWGVPVTLLVSGNDARNLDINETYLEQIVSMFFQPFYYSVNYQPVVFVQDKGTALENFLDCLQSKAQKQGLAGVQVIEATRQNSQSPKEPGFAIFQEEIETNYFSLVESWIDAYVDGKHPPEIHVLIPDVPGKEGIILQLEHRLAEVKGTRTYGIAETLYQNERLLDGLKNEVHVKEVSEKNIQLYLNLQKDNLADSLKWYHYEYEILPAWYKRLGHLLKVIIGKRSFRSLFDDKTKKYKD